MTPALIDVIALQCTLRILALHIAQQWRELCERINREIITPLLEATRDMLPDVQAMAETFAQLEADRTIAHITTRRKHWRRTP